MLRQFVRINIFLVGGSLYLRRRVTTLALTTKFRDGASWDCQRSTSRSLALAQTAAVLSAQRFLRDLLSRPPFVKDDVSSCYAEGRSIKVEKMIWQNQKCLSEILSVLGISYNNILERRKAYQAELGLFYPCTSRSAEPTVEKQRTGGCSDHFA